MPRPFNVFWDADSAKYFIFAPPGCVLVGGVAVEIAGAGSDLNVELPFQNDLPSKLYAHVTADEEATGGYKVEFDGNPTKQNAAYDFCVASFGAVENDGGQYDVCTSVVSLGTATPDPDDVSIEVLEGDDESKKLQIKDFDEPVAPDVSGCSDTLLGMLGIPETSCASAGDLTAPMYGVVAKKTTTAPSSSGSSELVTGNTLAYLHVTGTANKRPLLFNGERLCNVVADGDDTDVEIVVPALAPVPESGITIQTVLDSEGYPVIMIGYSGGSSGGGSSWSGYHTTGSSADVIMCGLRYTDNQLQAKFCDEVWDNGLLVSRTFHNSWTVITTAVPESVCQCSSNANGAEQGGSSQS